MIKLFNWSKNVSASKKVGMSKKIVVKRDQEARDRAPDPGETEQEDTRTPPS